MCTFAGVGEIALEDLGVQWVEVCLRVVMCVCVSVYVCMRVSLCTATVDRDVC